MSRTGETDPEADRGELASSDPEEEGGDLEPFDPEDEGGDLEPFDPEEEGGDLEPFDPEEEGGDLEPFDPETDGDLDLVARREQGLRSAQQARSYDWTTAEQTGVPTPEKRFGGDIIVRLSPLLPPTDQTDLIELAEALDLDGLKTTLERFGSPVSTRAITTPRAGRPGGASPRKQGRVGPRVSLDDLELRAAKSDLPPRHSLWSYWRLDARHLIGSTQGRAEFTPENRFPYSNTALANHLVEQLNALSEVGLAYRELAASDPNNPAGGFDTFVPPSDDMLSDFQFYCGKSPLGLDARWARIHLDDPSEKVALADLEQGWICDHEDLGSPSLVHGDNRHGTGTYRGNHGTAVVSQLVAVEGNQFGVVGIAAGAAAISLSSHYRDGAVGGLGTSGHVADAISALITGDGPALGPGDVLLLEVQRAGQPTEVDPLDFDAIRLAVANGIIVVEAGGNGRINLNRLRTVDGRSLHRRSARFRDSGAIMVGAARAAAPHNRSWFSNHGSRIDCFAWGDSVVAAGYGDYQSGDERRSYSDRFSGTSSAAPMIAGAAILVQGLFLQNAAPHMSSGNGEPKSWRRLSPGQMRSLLSNPRTGTRQGRAVRGSIGVMPNLRLVVDRALGIVPQVYLRDHIGDTGTTPAVRRFCSPDIIVTKVAAGEVKKEFGQASPSTNQDVFDAGLDSPGKKRVCVRVCNRGLQEAGDVRARIYCAPLCTLVTPDRWQELPKASSVSIGAVPQGDTFAVSQTVEYELEESRSLVAVVEDEGRDEGPVPCHLSSFDWGRHLRVMRSQRNVAVRNVHAVDLDGRGTRELGFIVNGTPDAPRAFELELIQRLPRQVTTDLTAPLALALKLARGRLWSPSPNGGSATLHLPRQPRVPFGATPLPAAVDFPCVLVLRGADALRLGHSIAIRQLYRGEEVGRITWRFHR